MNLSQTGDTLVTKAGSAGGRTPPAFGSRWRLKTPCPNRMGSVLRIITCCKGWDICVRKDAFTRQILEFVLQWNWAGTLGTSSHPKCSILLRPFIYKASSLQATPHCHLPTLYLPKNPLPASETDSLNVTSQKTQHLKWGRTVVPTATPQVPFTFSPGR